MSDTTIDTILAEFGRKCSPVATLRNVDNPLVRREYIDQAKSALYDLILKEVVPEKITDSPLDTFWKDEMSSNAKMTGFNEATDEMRNKLKELFDE